MVTTGEVVDQREIFRGCNHKNVVTKSQCERIGPFEGRKLAAGRRPVSPQIERASLNQHSTRNVGRPMAEIIDVGYKPAVLHRPTLVQGTPVLDFTPIDKDVLAVELGVTQQRIAHHETATGDRPLVVERAALPITAENLEGIVSGASSMRGENRIRSVLARARADQARV